MEDILSTSRFFHNWDPRHVAHSEIGHFHDVYLRPNLVKFIIIIFKLSLLSEYLHNAKSILLLNQILKMSLQAWNESFAKLSTIPLKETYRDRASYGTRKKTQCATDEIDEPSTRERSSRRLIGARLLKYLLGFDRSQLREESTQSQYYRRPRSVVELCAGIRGGSGGRGEKEASRDAETRRPTILSSRGIY